MRKRPALGGEPKEVMTCPEQPGFNASSAPPQSQNHRTTEAHLASVFSGDTRVTQAVEGAHR
jgi:hypothetical protein